MFGARSFAMAVNRLVDAAIDARNPRTAGRELPAGRLRRIAGDRVRARVARASSSLGVSQLAPITRWLAPLVVVPMVIYPYLKRYTPLCHLWLGVVDGLAPVGGWVAVTGHFDIAAWLLGAAVACWIAASTSSTRRWTSRSTARRGCTRCRPTTASRAPSRSRVRCTR